MAILDPRTARLRTGESAVLRSAAEADAAALVALGQSVAVDSPWNITLPEEFTITSDQERTWIAEHAARPGWIAIVATIQETVVGLIHFENAGRLRVQHHGSFGLSVALAWRGRGVGDALLGTLVAWAAAEPRIEKVGLAVVADNLPALALYRKHGFVEEGRRVRHVRRGPGDYSDDVLMYRLVKS